jgi:hypothetical protein
MLTEQFVASIAAPTKPNTGVTKDAGIFLHEFQPLAAQRHVFKKSASKACGLAVSSSHIFAAQEGKAVVHVYSREKGNQEAIVPFQERIHSVALACGDTVLLLGAESGRILVWEVRFHPWDIEDVSDFCVDMFWPSRVYLYFTSPACDYHCRGPDVELLPLRLRRFHDPRMESAFHSILLSRHITHTGAHSVYSPWAHHTSGMRSQLHYIQHRRIRVPG